MAHGFWERVDDSDPWESLENTNVAIKRGNGKSSIYPLVMTNIAMENHHLF
jgi:hypothetical protein